MVGGKQSMLTKARTGMNKTLVCFKVALLCAVFCVAVILASDFSDKINLTGAYVFVPANINIALGGFRGDGGHNFDIFQKIPNTPAEARPFYENIMDVAQYMSDLYPLHRQHCIDTQQELFVRYTIDYSAFYLETSEMRNLEHLIGQNMKYVGREMGDDRYTFIDAFEVDIQAVTKYFEVVYTNNIYEGKPAYTRRSSGRYLPRAKDAYSIMFLNFNKQIIYESYLQTPDAKATETRRKALNVNTKSETPKDYESFAKSFVYRYRLGNGLSQAWISRSRFIVVDMSAGPVEYGNSDSGEGTVTSESYPSIVKSIVFGGHPGDVSNAQQMALKLRAQIGSNVISAIKNVFLPDIQFENIQYAEKLLVSVIVFRNHEQFNPLVDKGEYFIDLELIKSEISKLMLPQQEISFISGVHSLHDHKALSLALSQSMMHDSINSIDKRGGLMVKNVPYIDGKALMKALLESSDYLTAGLLRKTTDESVFLRHSAPDLDVFDVNRALSKGVKILPVYVFSLMNQDSDILFNDNIQYIANRDAVVALQTTSESAESAFFSQLKQLPVDMRNPTRAIIAGLSTSIGGLVPPYLGYSDIHKRNTVDYIWAHGFHPFGPFSNSTTISPIFSETAIRNQIISRIDTSRSILKEAMDNLSSFVQKYVHDPFGDRIGAAPKYWIDQIIPIEDRREVSPLPIEIYEKLQSELVDTQRQLYNNIADLLHNFELDEAFAQSAAIVHRATAFRQYIDTELERASTALFCCTVSHQVPTVMSFWSFLVLSVLLVVFAVFLLYLVYLTRRSSLVK